MNRFIVLLTVCFLVWGASLVSAASDPASSNELTKQESKRNLHGAGVQEQGPHSSEVSANPYQARRHIYDKLSTVTGIPWYRLAAIDQYERTMTIANPKKRKTASNPVIGVVVEPPKWVGMLNPDLNDDNPKSIQLFKGIGKDGSGDDRANLNDETDLLYSVASYIGSFGPHNDDFAIGLWNYYENSRAVQRIIQFARLYEHFDRIQINERAFPLPVSATYAYRSTWGMGRHYGGFRIHEGTDIFASHGVPVRSTCFGIVEVKGWNRLGGWRIGIRDINNLYHYYAHLSGYDKQIKQNDIVSPGQIIGWVGSSGYGKPGTSGKFPPHLHFGIYRDRGLIEYAFDPYPSLKKWEQDDKRKERAARKQAAKGKSS